MRRHIVSLYMCEHLVWITTLDKLTIRLDGNARWKVQGSSKLLHHISTVVKTFCWKPHNSLKVNTRAKVTWIQWLSRDSPKVNACFDQISFHMLVIKILISSVHFQDTRVISECAIFDFTWTQYNFLEYFLAFQYFLFIIFFIVNLSEM